MARLTKQEIERERSILQLHFEHFRLTEDHASHLVLGAILTLSVSIGRSDTNSIPVETVHAQTRQQQESEARMYRKPCDPALTIEEVWVELERFAQRGLITLEIPRPGNLIATPLISSWHKLPSVRKDHTGKLVRSEW